MAERKYSAGAGLAIFLGLFFLWSALECGAQTGAGPQTGKTRDHFQGMGFIAARPLPSWGAIVGSKDDAVNLTDGEIIFVRLAFGKEGKVGDRFTILHAGDRITHPVTGRKMGRAMLVCGELTLLERSGDLYTAQISKSTRSIHVGDEILPTPAIMESTSAQSSSAPIQGFILAPVENEENITEKELVFIDRGGQDGVLVGDLFAIYYTGGSGSGPAKAGAFPPYKIGEAVVISVQEETSTVVVTHSSQSIRTGDPVVSRKK
jgi:hypothetical protein